MGTSYLARKGGHIVSNKNNIIEINGRRYDAVTGSPLAKLTKDDTTAAPTVVQPTVTPIKTAVKQPTMRDVVRQPASHANTRVPETARTLMRSAVSKPVTPENTIQTTKRTVAKRPLADVVKTASVNNVDPQRVQRAGQVPKSRTVRKFAEPAAINTSQLAARPVMPVPAHQPQPVAPVKRELKTTADVLEQALQGANSHQQAMPDSTRSRRWLKPAALTAVAVAVIGILGIQALPGMRLQLASTKAGFKAGLPDYQPAGYGLAQLSYSPGVVASRFNSHSDDRSYTLIQKKSDWDSRTLRDDFVASADPHYRTEEKGGRTIYIYGSRNATWVNGGIWYQIQSDGSLSDGQLVELAGSL